VEMLDADPEGCLRLFLISQDAPVNHQRKRKAKLCPSLP